ncbi:MAG: nucleoside kinase, partial [Anaerococcus obesiensis]
MEILLNDEFLKTNKKFLYEIIKEKYPNKFKDYILANVNGKIVDLNYEISQDDKIDLIKKYTHIANLSYESTIALICMLAIEKIYKNKKVNIEYSVNNCLYLSVENFKILHKDIEKIKKEMENLIKEDFPIVKKTYKKTEALKIFKANDDLDKYNLLNSLNLNEINIY